MWANEFMCHPSTLRKPGKASFRDMDINKYQKQLKDERKTFTDDDFIGMYKDMVSIRAFEIMLTNIKKYEEYEGIKHFHAGPVHLAVGEESAAVGMAYMLKPTDFMFSTHRAHADVLAKGFSAIKQLGDDELMEIMKNFNDGLTLKGAEKVGKYNNVKELARNFLIYGMAAEIFAKEAGFNKGLGGSMHAFFIPFGILCNNGIVGGSAPLATGAALYRKVNRKPGVIVASIGDAALGCGPVFESMNFAAMKQFDTVWGEEFAGGLPIIYNVMDNLFGMGGRTKEITMAYDMPVRLAAGIAENQLYAERVDGYNVLAVIDAYKRKLKGIEERKEAPVLLDVLTYRFQGHTPMDPQNYRSKEEVEAWESCDAIASLRRQLVELGILKDADCDKIEADIKDQVVRSTAVAVDDDFSPVMNLIKDPDGVARLMYSNLKIEKFSEGKAEVLIPIENNSRVQQIASRERFHMKDGKKVSQNKAMQTRDAIFEAILDRMYEDPSMIFYGEDVKEWGGAQGVSRGLAESFPAHRLFNSPISEAAIVGTACGYGLSGGRALAEIMFMDFFGRCADELFNQLPKWQSMSAGILKMPVVIRCTVGAKYGAQHAQDWSALCTHIPGLKVLFPVTPYDSKGLLISALKGSDPVIFLESQKVYDKAEMFHEGGVPTGSYELPIGEPDVKRVGKDITILTVGATLYTALEAADELESKYGVSAEIIDARSLVPFNYEPVIESIKKTGKIVLGGDAVTRGSFMNTLAQNISELAFDYLDAPPVIAASRNWISPAAEFERDFFPQPQTFLDIIHEKVMPLKGHVCQNDFTKAEKLRREKLGV
ncbi:MAG: alpha-ketoacid dehydrogenase subunit alpha/beta [Christensenellales bacterium]